MIRVNGEATLKVPYVVDIDMTEEEWDAMSEGQQNEELESRINWYIECKNAEVDDMDVWDVTEIED